jgi:5-guanidino-2-oxopentanoate decarboxylase
MSADSQTTSTTGFRAGAQAVVEALLGYGISSGFGIPSIHNIRLYEVLRQTSDFHHWVVRHEQAAGFAADGFFRRSGRIAAVFASTGPGNLFTLAPLLESLQTNTPVLLIGTNIASPLLGKTGGALHETPQQTDIVRPLTRFAHRVSSPDEIPETIAAAAEMLRGPAPGPAFVEIPHDFFNAPVTTNLPSPRAPQQVRGCSSSEEIAEAAKLLAGSKAPVFLIGTGARADAEEVRQLAEKLQAPVFTTTSGKGLIADDHPLALGCISKLGAVQEVLARSDLLISFGAKLTEFDSGRFALRFPVQHLQIVEVRSYGGNRIIPTDQLAGSIGTIARALASETRPKVSWCDVAGTKSLEGARLATLKSDAYSALMLLRGALDREDIVVNDQSILDYWASAFFPVMAPGTFLYPTGSGTLGYALPAAIGAACAMQVAGEKRKVVCVVGDGGFQYTLHELATLAQYELPVKILLVNDDAYGIIGFLQRSLFGHTHEVALKNPDFCRLAEAYEIGAERVSSLEGLRRQLPAWLESPGPSVLEWRTELKAPWEIGAIPRPAGLSQGQK